MKVSEALFHLWWCTLAGSMGVLAETAGGSQPVIIDTDIFGDVDDVGALTVANTLQNCGLADVRGIAINTHSKYGALAANALCTYFGNGDIPVAAIRPLTNETYFDNASFLRGEYPSKVANNWPRELDDSASTPTPLEMYRSVLSAATENSINIISIGFLNNLADLLKSEPDKISSLSGKDLISSKVNKLVVMGGNYPSGWEYNFGDMDPQSTDYILRNWPKTIPMTFSGFELGGIVYSGQRIAENSPVNSPIVAAYQWYVGRGSTIRMSWDPITTLYGILGLDGFSKLGFRPMLAYANEDGYNSITSSNGSNAWVNDTSVTNQHWLKLADGVTNSSMAWLLDQFFIHDPAQQSCFGYLSE
ncbi:hypothetical protein N7510_003696 [Penicillium lagena]|uniref:uncharacterized protein n=1 Tax=Penicillium lagena TaxID=94218 RepID=UPI00254231EF|nr:uncharacterized protein N7510_003696 [Penicillium lagena]KAJ5619712.1 hypothetical protein N7510_003696 [Penicillium lagena]